MSWLDIAALAFGLACIPLADPVTSKVLRDYWERVSGPSINERAAACQERIARRRRFIRRREKRLRQLEHEGAGLRALTRALAPRSPSGNRDLQLIDAKAAEQRERIRALKAGGCTAHTAARRLTRLVNDAKAAPKPRSEAICD